MPVSEREQQYMHRIGVLKAGSHEEARTQHRSLPLDERLRQSWRLFLSLRPAANLHNRHDDPSPFYERARRLGLHDE
jgi:hypothetical protein